MTLSQPGAGEPVLATDLGARSGRFVEAEHNWSALGVRVLHVIPGHPDRGPMIFARRQVASFVRAGAVVKTVYLSSRMNPRVLVREALEIRRIARSFRPHLIHAHYGTVTAMLCACVSPVPLVITFRGSDLNPVRAFGRARAAIARLLSQGAALRAARIICVSGRLKERLWWRTARVAVIPNGVDLRLFHPRPRDEVRRELGWSAEDRVILFNVGRNPQTKGLDLAQAAFGRARAARADLRLELLDGHQPPARVPLLLNAADCLLVTSDHEGSPNIVKEALACNLPVVSVDVGDVAERLAGVTPSRVVDRSERVIAEALLEVVELGARSNGAAVVGDLSEDRIAERVLSVYHDVIGSRPRTT